MKIKKNCHSKSPNRIWQFANGSIFWCNDIVCVHPWHVAISLLGIPDELEKKHNFNLISKTSTKVAANVFFSMKWYWQLLLLNLKKKIGLRLTWRVPLVEQELPTLPEHLSSPPGFSGVRVTPFLVLCVCFVLRCLSFCPFSFGHCVVCSYSIYGFWLPLCYLQTLLSGKNRHCSIQEKCLLSSSLWNTNNKWTNYFQVWVEL